MTDKDQVKIPTQIKDQDLVQRRRNQIADAAVGLFIKKGFHKTTTRQIAQEAGVSYQGVWKFTTNRQRSLPLGVAEAVFVNLTGVYFS